LNKSSNNKLNHEISRYLERSKMEGHHPHS